MAVTTDNRLIELTSEVVSAFISNNSISGGAIGALLIDVHRALQEVSAPDVEAIPTKPLIPAVPVKKSVHDDFIVCLEDGKRYKSLRRHLSSAFGMTPEQYRAKWGLPADYPMVAKNYSAARSGLAKSLGFGHRQRRSGARVKLGVQQSRKTGRSQS